MSCVATLANQSSIQNYLVRNKDTNIIFVPIKSVPRVKNFFLLETCVKYKFSEEHKKFIPYRATAILFLKKGENTQKLQAFTAGSFEKLMEKVAQKISTHYLHKS